MAVFYQHNDKQFVNFNEITREQLVRMYNHDYNGFLEFLDNLFKNNLIDYIKILKLLDKDIYVYLNCCFNNNDTRVLDKIFFENFKMVDNQETFEEFILENDDALIEFGMYFNSNNPIFKTRCFIELTEEQNQKICELYPEHILDLQDYVEDLGVKTILGYYHYLVDENEDIIKNTMIAQDIYKFLNYLYEKNKYLFEKTINEIKNKIYKWNKFLIDNSKEENIIEDESLLIELLESKDNMELGEIALENPNIMNEMLFQLFEYEMDNKLYIIDEFGNNKEIVEEQVDEYIKKISKKLS